jgi:predicted acetylornithine/succinylornithine family transaminase
VALKELQSLERDAVMETYARLPVEFVRGEGTRLWDDEGHEYLDFFCGAGVTQLGHCPPAVVEAVRDQAGRLLHTSNLFYTEPGIRLAERLVDSSIDGRAFLCNSGAEAVECALKLARKRRRGGKIVVLEGAFHGRTYGALSATPQESKQAPFAPLVPGFQMVRRDDPEAFLDVVDESTAAVLIEPVQGEGGVHPISDEVLVAARLACDKAGALLIFDEVQCGMGRTGSLWAWQQTPVRPDVMTVAKGLAGGLPMGACISSPEQAGVLQFGDHATTFGGGPLVSRAALAALAQVDDQELLNGVAEKGERLAEGLRGLGLRVRGRGLMLAFEELDAPGVVRRALAEQRLVLNATGPETVRLLPPLTVSEAEIDEALRRIAALI